LAGALQLFAIMMAIMIPIIMLVFVVEYFKYKKFTNRALLDLQKELAADSSDDLKKELAALQERINVLEQIITDRNYELERKIGSL